MNNYVELSNKFFQSYNEGDIDAVEKALSPTIDFAHHNRGFATRNRDELIGILRQFADLLMPNRRFSAPSRVTAAGNTVIRESRWTGTPVVDIPGMAKAGESVEMNLCSVLTFDDDGVIVEWKDFG